MSKIVLMGDIGIEDPYHAGDEAMAEATVEELSSRIDVEVVAVSAEPAATERRYGWPSVRRFGFEAASGVEAHEKRLADVCAAAAGDAGSIGWSDSAWDVIRAVAAADAVVISGGGNLSSTWPEHVYERAALAKIAATFNTPLVVTGQTIGPHLTARHGVLVGAAITSAALVGVREGASYDLARQLGVPSQRLVATIDDAAHLTHAPDEWTAPVAEYVAATFAPHSGLLEPSALVEELGALVAATTEITGRDVVLVPHQGSSREGARTGDVEFHDRVKEASGVASRRVHSLPVLSARATAAAARGAQLVLSSRYHPVVFGLAAAVPSVALGVDAYTSTKIGGAMRNYGVESYALSAPSLVNGELRTAVTELWERRDEMQRHLRTAATSNRTRSEQWWDAVAAAVTGAPIPDLGEMELTPALRAGDWTGSATALRAWADDLSMRVVGESLARSGDQVARQHLEARILSLEMEVATLQAHLDEASDEAEDLRAAVHAAQQLVAKRLDTIANHLRSGPTVAALEAELAALQRTRTFRYLRAPRAAYGRLRRRRVR